MARYPDYQVEPSEPAPTRPTSLGLANFQQAKPEKETNLPLSPSLEAWLICRAQTLEGKDRQEKVTKPSYGPKTFPKLPSLMANRLEPSNAPGTGRSRTRARSARKRSVSLGRSSVNFNLRFRRFSPSSQIWIGGLPGCLTLSRISNPICLTMAGWNLFSEVSSPVLPFNGGTRDTSDGALFST